MLPRFSMRTKISSGFVRISAGTMPWTNWWEQNCSQAGLISPICCSS